MISHGRPRCSAMRLPEIGDRARGRSGRHHQINVAATPARHHDARLHAGGIEYHRRQIAVAGEIDALIGEALVDRRAHRLCRHRYPGQADTALLQLAAQPALFFDDARAAEISGLAGGRVDHRRDPHLLQFICGGGAGDQRRQQEHQQRRQPSPAERNRDLRFHGSITSNKTEAQPRPPRTATPWHICGSRPGTLPASPNIRLGISRLIPAIRIRPVPLLDGGHD